MKYANRMASPHHQAAALRTRGPVNVGAILDAFDREPEVLAQLGPKLPQEISGQVDRKSNPELQDAISVEISRRAYRAALITAARLDASLDRELLKAAELIAANAEPGNADVVVKISHDMLAPIQRLRKLGWLVGAKGLGDRTWRWRVTLSARWVREAGMTT
ncbi:hypothetical protein AS156_25750 [Bradyrhizobium macuxiense]|uniref:Uncharacterized protein n=1 Tax=Bradyrhizobium macuxiense TaxID=1755647 RepID=A0A109K648_9BRAD|nr:hypothetical protein [Bradyrhizobium macuxiense]KWV61124.1 hypothetical protein AS156_25750 [Bradyrhizobium macuxiense]